MSKQKLIHYVMKPLITLLKHCHKTRLQVIKIIMDGNTRMEEISRDFCNIAFFNIFSDGTMNTTGNDERFEAAVTNTGGSFLIHQRWEHNLDALAKMTLAEQEDIIGRKKDWSAELPQNKM